MKDNGNRHRKETYAGESKPIELQLYQVDMNNPNMDPVSAFYFLVIRLSLF